ncbi:hypothetical protein BTVI_159091 [Pitangus sulphuratus]|nr:hypothetical protein BTVI_159091 [Pitangus sulphuratus]
MPAACPDVSLEQVEEEDGSERLLLQETRLRRAGGRISFVSAGIGLILQQGCGPGWPVLMQPVGRAGSSSI